MTAEPNDRAGNPGTNAIARRPFVAELLARRAGALVVPSLGSATWDCFAAGDSADYLYSWGAMGQAVPTALGIAIAQPQRRVLAIVGDGEMLMGIGALAVVADQAPANLAILVLDNESFGETGRQTGLTASRTDITKVAEGFGLAAVMTVREVAGMDALAAFLFERPGPVLAVAKIGLSEDPWALPVKDGVAIARRFRIALGLETP